MTSGRGEVVHTDAVGVEVTIDAASKGTVVAATMDILVPNDTVD
jgi:hypothetical protein